MNKGVSKKQKILNYINESEIELYPKQIKDKLGINHSTVKNYCRDLYNESKVIQPYPGTYASKITYGMMLAPVKIHNVILNVDAPYLNYSDDKKEEVGSVKIWIQFGLQRRKITIRISNERGMDRDTFLFALNRSYDIIEKRTGHVVEDVVVRTFELNRDIAGVKLDTVKCFTRQGFKDMLERIYQKGDFVRSEIKISREMSVSQVENMLRGGVTHGQDVQFQYMLVQEVKKLTKAVIHQQSQIKNIFNLLMGKTKKEK